MKLRTKTEICYPHPEPARRYHEKSIYLFKSMPPGIVQQLSWFYINVRSREIIDLLPILTNALCPQGCID
jgi:hypothetical protein